MFLMNGLMAEPGSEAHTKATKEKTRLHEWLSNNRIRMVDEIDTILGIQDRFDFIRQLKQFLACQPSHIADLFKTPLYFELVNRGTTDEKVTAFKQQAAAVGLDFPVLVKSKIGAKDKNAHKFFCINNEQGLPEALEFFDGMDLLI